MKILWLGVEIGPETKKKLLAGGGQIKSAQVSEHNLLSGIKALEADIETINGPLLNTGTFPVVPEETWSDEISDRHLQVGYRNRPYLNRLHKERALREKAKEWAQRHRGADDVKIIVYSMHTAFLSAAQCVKKILPQAQIVLIVPDLPRFMDLNKSAVKRVLKALDGVRIRHYLKSVDKYVLYAESMAEYLKLRPGQWMRMEGSYDTDLFGEGNPSDDRISVMYSGVLDTRYGIPEFLDAMSYLDDRFEFWLTGDGNARPLVEQAAAQDGRIRYFGYLPSRKDLLDKQASATMLINTRKDTEQASKYCFPSKLFEYMVSGRPVLTCMVAGIPKEYAPYLVPIATVSAEAIADAIRGVADMAEEHRQSIGQRAKQFVVDNKGKARQASRIVGFLKE